MKEAKQINRSVSALGNCVAALAGMKVFVCLCTYRALAVDMLHNH